MYEWFFHPLKVCTSEIIKKKKRFGNNCGSLVRNLKVIAETNKTIKNWKPCLQNFWSNIITDYIKYFTLQGKIPTFE